MIYLSISKLPITRILSLDEIKGRVCGYVRGSEQTKIWKLEDVTADGGIEEIRKAAEEVVWIADGNNNKPLQEKPLSEKKDEKKEPKQRKPRQSRLSPELQAMAKIEAIELRKNQAINRANARYNEEIEALYESLEEPVKVRVQKMCEALDTVNVEAKA